MSSYSTICCDADDNGEQCMTEDSPPGMPKSATVARQKLARAGWRHTRAGRDICPSCWEAGRR